MHKESFSLILNSQTSTNIINNSNLANLQYNVNWLNILPQKYRRYNVKFIFASDNANTVGGVGPMNNGVQTYNGVYYGGPIFIGMKYFNLNNIYTITSFLTGTGYSGTYSVEPVATINPNLIYSTNTTFNSNVICSVNFGSNNTIENNSSSNKIGTIYPYSYPVKTDDLYTSNLIASVTDNQPIEILYPSNSNITVNLTNINGTSISRMTHYHLQLYFEPIEENVLLSGSY
jgi:hypothetical protein